MIRNYHNNATAQIDRDTCRVYGKELIKEEPLVIRVEGNPYSVIMRTPGDEIFHAAGFCLAEGLVDTPDDFAAIGHCKDMDANVVTVTLTPERRKKVGNILNRQSYISQTSCGICGKVLIEDLLQNVTPIRNDIHLSITQAMECVDILPEYQVLYNQTAASHAAMILDTDLNFLSVAEDVGRHNALDKAIGKVFMNKEPDKAAVAVISSRISYEMVQKAARAKLPIMISMSRPTALAVDMARSLNMTLACSSKKRGFQIFCRKFRFSAGRP